MKNALNHKTLVISDSPHDRMFFPSFSAVRHGPLMVDSTLYSNALLVHIKDTRENQMELDQALVAALRAIHEMYPTHTLILAGRLFDNELPLAQQYFAQLGGQFYVPRFFRKKYSRLKQRSDDLKNTRTTV